MWTTYLRTYSVPYLFITGIRFGNGTHLHVLLGGRMPSVRSSSCFGICFLSTYPVFRSICIRMQAGTFSSFSCAGTSSSTRSCIHEVHRDREPQSFPTLIVPFFTHCCSICCRLQAAAGNGLSSHWSLDTRYRVQDLFRKKAGI